MLRQIMVFDIMTLTLIFNLKIKKFCMDGPLTSPGQYGILILNSITQDMFYI